MIAAQRRRAILRQIEEDGYVEASRLSADLGVDVSTIRRDLDSLARLGLAHRTHGGALRSGPPGPVEPGAGPGEQIRAGREQAIARAAAGLVATGDTVALDAGSATSALARELTGKEHLTVVTNDLRIAHDLAAPRRIRLLVIGGELAEGDGLVGPWSEQILATIHVDWAFLGADGLDAAAGVTTDDVLAVPVKRAMLAASGSAAVVADSSKFGLRALATVAQLHEFDRIITDDGLAVADRAPYGPALLLASTGDQIAAG